MGKQLHTALEGSFGPVIYYKSRGEYLVRSKGKTGTQAAVAKKQAAVLGTASAISAKLRAALKPLIPGRNRKLMYRMNNALQQWLRTNPLNNNQQVNEITELKGFSLSENEYGALLQEAFKVSRDPGTGISIHIPAFDSPNPIAPLPFNGKIEIKIIAACCNIQTGMSMRSFDAELDITYTGNPIPVQQLSMQFEPGKGELTVVALSINAMTAGIVAAMSN